MTQQKQRYIYIDLLRGWAVIVMIEVHVFNAFLLPHLREESWFEVLNFINGLVAPSFLFVAGYSFVLIAQRKWNDYLATNTIFWKQIGRIAQVWAVGYALHLPVFSFSRLMSMSWDEWGMFWEIDILHCIALSLLILLLLVLLTRTQKKFFPALAALSCGVIFASPLLHDLNIDWLLPLPIANYISAAHRSQFPIFPWMGFVLCGGIASQLLIWWKNTIPDKEIFRRFTYAGVAMIVISIVVDLIPFSLYPDHNYWSSSPEFFFVRLGLVLLLLSSLWYWEQRMKSGKSIVSIVGSESLVAYAGHLLVIYGLFWNNQSLAFVIGKVRTVPEVTGMTMLLIAATAAASYFWHRIKNWSMFYARVMQYSILVVVLYIFFTKPF